MAANSRSRVARAPRRRPRQRRRPGGVVLGGDQLVLEPVDAARRTSRAARPGCRGGRARRSGSSSMRSSSIARRSAGGDRRRRTGRGRPPAPRRAAARAQKPWNGRDRRAPRRAASSASSSALAQRVGGGRRRRSARGSTRARAPCSRPARRSARRSTRRLAGAGAADDEQRAAGMRDGLALRGGQAVEHGTRRIGAGGGLRSRAALTPTGSGACRAAADALRAILRRRARPPPSACVETGTRGEGGDRTLVIDARRRGRGVRASSRRLHDEGARFTAVSRGARRRSTSATPTCCVVIDPIDGSLNAKRGLPAPRDLDRGRRRADDGRRRLRLRLRLRARARSGSRAAARARWLDERPLPTDAGERRGARRPARAARDRVGRPALGARGGRRAGRARRTGCARSARSPSTLCQVAAARLDGMVTLRALPRGRRRRGAADRARGRRPVAFPCFDDPLGAPLDLAPHSPVVAARTESRAGRARAHPAATVGAAFGDRRLRHPGGP